MFGTEPFEKFPVPPIRSSFPDHGPDPDFFEEIGPDLVRILVEKSDFWSK